MLLSYDPDMLNRFKTILNTIFNFNYKKIKKKRQCFQKTY